MTLFDGLVQMLHCSLAMDCHRRTELECWSITLPVIDGSVVPTDDPSFDTELNERGARGRPSVMLTTRQSNEPAETDKEVRRYTPITDPT